jgi:hypothetical protein
MLYWHSLLTREMLTLEHFQLIQYHISGPAYLRICTVPADTAPCNSHWHPTGCLKERPDLSLRPAPLQGKGGSYLFLLTSCRWNLSQTVSCFWSGGISALPPLSFSCAIYHNHSRHIDRRTMESMELVTIILAMAPSRSHISDTRIDLSGKQPYRSS